jgi:hypothetical protein
MYQDALTATAVCATDQRARRNRPATARPVSRRRARHRDCPLPIIHAGYPLRRESVHHRGFRRPAAGPKERRGPSDDQATGGAGKRERPTRGGVDARAGKAHLYARARQLGIQGRSRMSKAELVDALEKASRRETARARK